MKVQSHIKEAIDSSVLVRRLWHYCNVLRDDGLSYPDYVEQLTYLLFLKMSDERYGGPVPAKFGWKSFADLPSDELADAYSHALAQLGTYDGMLGLIFSNAKNKIRDPAKLKLLVTDLIGQLEWSSLSSDVKGDAYEGLLEKNARDTKSGAGQYFTPRALIEAIVECVNPRLGEVICDPACGTGGFLLAAHRYLLKQVGSNSAELTHLHTQTLRGVELVEEVARLSAMNLMLHGVTEDPAGNLPIRCADSLSEPPREQMDIVVANPPFGVRGTVKYRTSEGLRGFGDLSITRKDFWATTANKQLNFLQHIFSLLKPGGRAAVVVPDNVLFESGAASMIRKRLLDDCDVHTVLRLPPGVFYAQGVKSNVLFFDKLPAAKEPSGHTWVYDLRSEKRFSIKSNPLSSEDLREFVDLYRGNGRGNRSESSTYPRWRKFRSEDIRNSEDHRLDLSWPLSTSPKFSDTGRLEELSRQIADDLHRALFHVMRAANGTSDE
ncbi:class I SAM-dependent DNA methyltransferase [Streptomyces nigra]|uniref:class I SAM-dependent DNA methyltransferase n=1 Tax=Streptomyces nigra TaxID=1827580 RepID=UPI003815225E